MHDLIECIKILDLSGEILEVLKIDRDSEGYDWDDSWDYFMASLVIGLQFSKDRDLIVDIHNHLVNLQKFLYPDTTTMIHTLHDGLEVEFVFVSSR